MIADIRNAALMLFSLMAVLGHLPARAGEVTDLYVAELGVASQQRDEFWRGVRKGMENVLIRVSGDASVTRNSEIRRALTKPEEYYYQFSYETRDEARLDGAMNASGAGASSQILRIHFEPSAIAQLLRNTGFPVWGKIRPSVLVWLVMETDSGRTILTEDLEHPLSLALLEQARLRGLPMLFPLLDLEDQGYISVSTLWGSYHNQIEAASHRYDADGILTGRIYQGLDGEWIAHWSYKFDDEWSAFDNLQIHLNELVGEVVARLVDELADKYGIQSSRGNVLVRVEAVEDLADYVQLSGYLENLAPVLDLSVERVKGEEILYRLGTEGTAEQLIQLIELDQKLFLLSEESGETTTLHFQWLQ